MSVLNQPVQQTEAIRKVGRSFVLKTVIGAALLGAATLANAQSATPSSAPKILADDGSISWKGITLYGIIDSAVQYQTHGAPISDYYPAGSAVIVQKNSNHGIFGLVPNQMSQSRVGLTGVEPLGVADLQGVFRIETYFNPTSGQLSDGPRSLAANNGRALGNQTTNLDSSVAGQAFEQAYVGVSSKQWGTLTWGRQNTVLADLIAKYDPNQAAQGFSLIGLSGTTAGAGDTQDRRFDNSIKYVASFLGMVHVNAQYKFNNAYGGANQAFEVGVGAEYAGLSVDAIYADVRDAISAGALSQAQVTAFSTSGLGFGVDRALTATVTDNKSLTLGALYNMGKFKFYAGGEYIQYANPKNNLPVGFDDLGYKLAYVNGSTQVAAPVGSAAPYVLTAYTNPFAHPKQMQVYWAGAKWTPISAMDVTVAYYGYHQNAYGGGAAAGCSDMSAGTCSGNLHSASIDVDYRLSKRFDVYAGTFYTTVENGLGNGYLFSRNDLTTTTGARFKF